MAESLSPEQIEEFRETFQLFDMDGDGTVSVKELGIVMERLGQNPSKEELQDMIKDVDEDGSGEIDFDEFLQLMVKQLQIEDDGDVLEDALDAFRAWDENGSGVISSDELKTLLRGISERLSIGEIQDILKAADTKMTGNIDYEEFVRMMIKK